MRATILTIGNEILIGQIINTNAAFIGDKLEGLGITVQAVYSVGDTPKQIREILQYAAGASDLVIATGGLGPTRDDTTKIALCEYFQCKLVHHSETEKHIRNLLQNRGVAMSETNRNQAMVPSCAEILKNRSGTAPGLWFEKDSVVYVFLPGVPFEMKTILDEELFPRLKKSFVFPSIIHRTLLTQGIAESHLSDKLKEFEDQLPDHISLAYLPSPGLVRLRLSARHPSPAENKKSIEIQVNKLKEILGPILYGYNEDTLPVVVGELLKTKGLSVCTAESCTGGAIAASITSVPGSSAYFKGSIVAYANTMKSSLLDVPAELIEKHGAVSEQVVRCMAANALRVCNSDYSIATSGIAGPDGGSAQKPVGTVWIAIGSKNGIWAKVYQMGENRERTVTRTVLESLNLLRKNILGYDL